MKKYYRILYYFIIFFPFIRYIRKYHKMVEYGVTKDNVPFLKYGKFIFHGFFSTEKEGKTMDLLKLYLPKDFEKKYFMLMRDFITRYIFPHMMPTLKPPYPTPVLAGFHGQHKDAIADIKDSNLRSELMEVFRIKEDDVIINGGAFLGFGDLRVSEMLTTGKIFCIEAEEECYNMLKFNVEANNIKNVFPINAALWNKKELRDLMVTELQANSIVDQVVSSDNKVLTTCTTVDDIIAENSLTKVDFVSLTLNGAEVEALDGMKETLANHKPRIRLAGWYSRDNVPIWKLTSDKLKPFNYKVVVGKRGSVMAYCK